MSHNSIVVAKFRPSLKVASDFELANRSGKPEKRNVAFMSDERTHFGYHMQTEVSEYLIAQTGKCHSIFMSLFR